jgi:hypothetical protein
MLVDLFMVYNFLKRLATPFNEWEAYKLGIIDERGNILKKKKDFTLQKERSAFGVFDTMILKLKRLIEKVPGGKTRLASYAAALYLIKEGQNYTEETPDEVLEEQFMTHYMTLSESDINIQFEEIMNTAGGGNIAGLPPDDPPMFPKAQAALLRRNKRKKKDGKILSN